MMFRNEVVKCYMDLNVIYILDYLGGKKKFFVVLEI
jgi:hypothetical protein